MPTTIKAALKKWEEASGKKSSEAKEIKLIGVYPPIEKMEGPLHILVNCEKLSLSTNLIVNIQNLQVLKNLRVLSLGRNLIKSLAGIEGAGETLEQLWISYNQIDKLKPIRNMTKLHTLYMAHNLVGWDSPPSLTHYKYDIPRCESGESLSTWLNCRVWKI